MKATMIGHSIAMHVLPFSLDIIVLTMDWSPILQDSGSPSTVVGVAVGEDRPASF